MRCHTTIFPGADDRPARFLGGTTGNAPILYLDRLHGDSAIAFHFGFGSSTAADAVAYLRRLCDEATELADDIERTQRS